MLDESSVVRPLDIFQQRKDGENTMKAECWWCGDPEGIASHGMIYLHQKCFDKITDMNDKIEYAVKYAKGEMPRVLANGDKQGYASIEKFLVAMDDFHRRWENTTKLIASLTKSCNGTKKQKS